MKEDDVDQGLVRQGAGRGGKGRAAARRLRQAARAQLHDLRQSRMEGAGTLRRRRKGGRAAMGVPEDCPVLVDIASVADWEGALAPYDPPEPEEIPPPEAFFGPHLPQEAGALTLWPEMRVAEAEPSAAVVTLQPPPEQTASGLELLPDAGPAVLWMLRKCGIASLQDLATADLSVLTARLGLVGQIIDLPGWRQFARARTARAG